eukprot:PhM_4_TR9629/c0_g1_i1/m.89203
MKGIFVIAVLLVAAAVAQPMPQRATPVVLPSVDFTVSFSVRALSTKYFAGSSPASGMINASAILSNFTAAVNARAGLRTDGKVSLLHVQQAMPYNATTKWNCRVTVALKEADPALVDRRAIEMLLRTLPAELSVDFASIAIRPGMVAHPQDFRDPDARYEKNLSIIGPFMGVGAAYVVPILVVIALSFWKSEQLTSRKAYVQLEDELDDLRHDHVVLKGEYRILRKKFEGVPDEEEDA